MSRRGQIPRAAKTNITRIILLLIMFRTLCVSTRLIYYTSGGINIITAHTSLFRIQHMHAYMCDDESGAKGCCEPCV